MASNIIIKDEPLRDDREFLENQYSPSRWSNVDTPDKIIEKHCKKITEASKNSLGKTANDIDVKYGKNSGQKLDIFFPESSSSSDKERLPVLLFFHGGYWQDLGKEYYSFLGETFGCYDIITVLIGYDLAPKVKLDVIFNEAQEAVVYIRTRFPSSPLVVSGHSAGAHLASLLMKVNWTSLGLSEFPFTGVIPISGVYDLRPLVNTYVNDALKMDEEEAWMLSPMNYMEEIKSYSKCKILCLIGQHESPEFHRQSKEFSSALQNAGFEVELEVVKDTDHFSIIHNFALENYQLTKIVTDCIRRISQKQT